MRAQLVEKEKMVALGQIAAGVAHEVGNPLSSISSIVQMLKRTNLEGATRTELDLIDTHVARITAIVRQMGRLARPARDTWEPLDVGEIIREAVRLISYDPRAESVEITCDCPPSLPRTYGLRDQLQQVFINLSLNALDAMPRGGTLQLSAQPQRGSIVVRVADSGSGICPDTGRRVFEPFVTTKEPGLGTGLGLAVSYGIVQKHGGTIDFESSVGEGTVFTVELPLMDSPPELKDG
jgi:signal transduction histidine kinase